MRDVCSNNHARQLFSDCLEPEPSGEGPNGTFDICTDRAAFFDKVAIGVYGRRRKRVSNSLQKSVNLPIGGLGRHYARSQHGVCKFSLNAFELQYGLLQNYPSHFPQARLIMRSEWMPVTGSGILLLVHHLFQKGATAYPANVELTFDLSGISVEHFKRACSAKVRTQRIIASSSGTTLYFGSPRSSWELRAYEKPPVLRAEFVFRLPFLRRHGIHSCFEMSKLARLDLRTLVSFSDAALSTKFLRMQQRLIS